MDTKLINIKEWEERKSLCYAAFIVTTDIEFEAIIELFHWKKLIIAETGYMYYFTSIKIKNKVEDILLVRQSEMGMMASAVTATMVVSNYSPKYIFLPGLMAGISQQEKLIPGQIIFANMFWNCTSGHFVDSDKSEIDYGNFGFNQKVNPIYLNKKLVKKIEDICKSKECQWPVCCGPVACSNSVMENKRIIDEQVISSVSDTVGLDMESYGVAYTCRRFRNPTTYPIFIKAVSDFADSNKSYKYQEFAAKQSCEFAKFLLERL